jgi:hypothetical protein
MNLANRVLGTLSSCLVMALCLALCAASAQAEGNYFVEGKKVTEKVGIEGVKEEKVAYGFLLPKLNFELVFDTFTTDNGSISTEGKGNIDLLLTKGKVWLMKPLQLTACVPGNLTFKLKSTLFLHEGTTYMLLEPAEGTTMTITTYDEECALGEENPVTGSIVVEDASKSFGTEKIEHLVLQAPAGLFPEHQLLFGGAKDTLSMDGSWTLKLNGKEGGKKWSAVG